MHQPNIYSDEELACRMYSFLIRPLPVVRIPAFYARVIGNLSSSEKCAELFETV